MRLHSLVRPKSNKTKKKRLGRGIGSGVGGHTVGRGQKGQKSRSGHSIPVGFEGGQVPLYKKLPKLGGFKNPTSKKIISISLVKLNLFEDGGKVVPQDLVKKGVIKKVPKDGVKILANGNLHRKLELEGFLVTKQAKKLIEKSGSKINEAF